MLSGQQLAIYGDGMSNPILSPSYEAATESAGGGSVNIQQSTGKKKRDRKLGIRPGSEVIGEATTQVGSTGVRSYAVQTGDTLRSIAQSMYGTASLWWKIADANGLLGDAGLQAGQVLSISHLRRR